MTIGTELANAADIRSGVSQPDAIVIPAPTTATVTGGKRSVAKATKILPFWDVSPTNL